MILIVAPHNHHLNDELSETNHPIWSANMYVQLNHSVRQLVVAQFTRQFAIYAFH